MKTLKELQARFGDVTFRGKTYTVIETADDAENVEDTCNWDSPDYVEAIDYSY